MEIKTKENQTDIENELCFAISEKIREKLDFSCSIKEDGVTFSYRFVDENGLQTKDNYLPNQTHLTNGRTVEIFADLLCSKLNGNK